jgi:hypothetical protein
VPVPTEEIGEIVVPVDDDEYPARAHAATPFGFPQDREHHFEAGLAQQRAAIGLGQVPIMLDDRENLESRRVHERSPDEHVVSGPGRMEAHVPTSCPTSTRIVPTREWRNSHPRTRQHVRIPRS